MSAGWGKGVEVAMEWQAGRERQVTGRAGAHCSLLKICLSYSLHFCTSQSHQCPDDRFLSFNFPVRKT